MLSNSRQISFSLTASAASESAVPKFQTDIVLSVPLRNTSIEDLFAIANTNSARHFGFLHAPLQPDRHARAALNWDDSRQLSGAFHVYWYVTGHSQRQEIHRQCK